MSTNLNIGSFFGIKVKIHWTFFFLIAWIVFDELNRGGTLESVAFNVTFILAVFLCVVLHEFGHALTAKRFGITTKKITLLPIGGMASFDKIPESPKEELLIVVAGPLVNVAIAILLFFSVPVRELFEISFADAYSIFTSFTLQNFLFYLFIVNVALVLFNLIPAFPMDGGRILRALLALKINRVKATQIAAGIGQFIAAIFLLVGLLYNPFLIFIALVIFLGAFGENQMVQRLDAIKGHIVEEAMLLHITTFEPKDSLELATKALVSGTETNFVVLEEGKVRGILYHKDIIENANKNKLVEAVMDTEFKTIKSTDQLQDVYELIYANKPLFLPVIDNGRLLGAIDAVNLNEFVLLQSKLVY